MTTTIELPVVQIIVLRHALRLELKGIMMSRHETALHAFKRLTGIEVGRGKKGRETALNILEQMYPETQEVADHE